MKWSDKKGIQHLVTICAAQGIKHVIVSPGSRNAPLTISFNRNPDFETYAIPDERVAGFVALGIAQQTESPAILICTSGSALLNYAPAVVEAFYRHVPLLVISADRPQYRIDQRDGQAINQKDVYHNHIKGSFCLPLEDGEDKSLWYQDRMINEAINLSMSEERGPVHINVPLEEPLYGLEEMIKVNAKVHLAISGENKLRSDQLQSLNIELAKYSKIMILLGQGQEKDVPTKALNKLLQDKKVVVLSECTSNYLGKDVVGCIDRNVMCISDEEWTDFQPELLITLAGNIVSKKIKQKLRLKGIHAHWHIESCGKMVDTFQCLTKTINTSPSDFLENVVIEKTDNEYIALWESHNVTLRTAHTKVLDELPFSDMTVFDTILKHIPENSQLHLANSSPVRYAQLFDHRTDLDYQSNRGVSGIDGSTSTAIGAAIVGDRIVTHISGDMSFFYDSNAFWHSHVPDNFRCIVINNGGGGIFRIIQGPDGVEELEQFFELHQENNDVGKIAAAYGVDFIKAEKEEDIVSMLETLYKDKKKATILEIVTPRKENSDTLKEYFKKIKAIKDVQ